MDHCRGLLCSGVLAGLLLHSPLHGQYEGIHCDELNQLYFMTHYLRMPPTSVQTAMQLWEDSKQSFRNMKFQEKQMQHFKILIEKTTHDSLH